MPKRGKVIRFPKSPPEPAGGSSGGDRGRPKDQSSPASARDARDPDGQWTEVRRCRDQAEALVVKSLFESEGIPCLLRSLLVHSVHPFTIGDQGEVIVLVPAAEADRARLLLARISAGPSFP